MAWESEGTLEQHVTTRLRRPDSCRRPFGVYAAVPAPRLRQQWIDDPSEIRDTLSFHGSAPR